MLGFRVQGSGFRVQGLGCGVWDFVFRVWGLRFRDSKKGSRPLLHRSYSYP